MKYRSWPSILFLCVILFFAVPVPARAASCNDIDFLYVTTPHTLLPVEEDIIFTVEYAGPDIEAFDIHYELFRKEFDDPGNVYQFYTSGTLNGSGFSARIADEGRYFLQLTVEDSSGSSISLFAGYFAATSATNTELHQGIDRVVTQCLASDADEDYEKAWFVHDYLITQADYQKGAARQYDPEGVLIDGEGVCQSYAYAFQLIMKALDIPCMLIEGTLDGGNHIWNLAQLDGKWYHIDCTADDPIDGATENDHAFMASDSTMAATHAWNRNFYPDCNANLDDAYKTISSDGFTFNAGYREITLSSYTGTEANVTIPSQINGRRVKRIENNCIAGNGAIQTLTISEGIEELVSLFVQNCSNLTSISLPSTANLIGAGFGIDGFIAVCPQMETVAVAEGNPYLCVADHALYNSKKTRILYYPPQCRASTIHVADGVQSIAGDTFAGNKYLQEAVLPDSVTSIGYWAFNQCSALQKVNIPEKCTEIGQYAFQGTALTQIHIPSSVDVILPPAFPETLHTITVSQGNPTYYAKDNVLFHKNGALITYAAKKPEKTYTIPDGITAIADSAFSCAYNLEKVVFPEGFASIQGDAFYCCKFKEIILPETITFIGDRAFFNCTKLEKLVIPASAKHIGDRILLGNVGAIIYGQPNSTAHLWAEQNGYAFCDIDTPGKISGAGTHGSNITWTFSEDGVLRISGAGEMAPCSSTPSWARYCNLIHTVAIEDGVTSVSAYAFSTYYKHLTSVILPKTLTALGDFAFSCESLPRVYIPEQVTQIDWYPFSPSDTVIYCISGSTAQKYADSHGFETVLVDAPYSFIIPPSVKRIESQAFTGIDTETVYIHAGVKEIAADAFDRGLILITPEGSYAEEWAAENLYDCIAE